jgi:hypothetical protein
LNGALLHHSEAAFTMTDKYIVTGYEDAAADKTYILVYDLAGSKKHSATETTVIGKLVTLAVKGDYILAGGDKGTGVYKINSTDLSVSGSGASDGKPSHWMKNSGNYVLESKEAGAEVKIWKWGQGEPAEQGSVTAPDPSAASGASPMPVRALQFDPANPDKAYMVSFTGGAVYELNLAAVPPQKNEIWRYPKYVVTSGGATVPNEFLAWMIEKAVYGGDTYFVLTGGYHTDLSQARAAPGISLIFKNPSGTAVSLPVTAENGHAGLVRVLRVLTDSQGNIYYAAKDRNATKLRIAKIN